MGFKRNMVHQHFGPIFKALWNETPLNPLHRSVCWPLEHRLSLPLYQLDCHVLRRQ
ncbi:unnamed protein product [Hymenolepis diminuta]|uniref:Uncharacterized protein n=1 Tax=Hymenolepis diminuta TaxID=6216 RepID=A0A564Z0Z5_HYMDI|nr:unnamed protein product [Hymenolepis diminuta]